MARPKTPKGKIETAATTSASATPAADVQKPAETAPVKTKSATRAATRKIAIVKPESRANLVPINVDDEIRRLAYLFSERRGFEAGHEAEDWLKAEREVRQRYHQQSASA